MGSSSFFSELKRRQIYRGGVMYVVAGWVIVQVAIGVFPIFDIPAWSIRLVIVAILLGFPLALVALWMFESNAPPEERLHDRRKSRDGGGGGGEQVAKLLADERAARQQETAALLAALQRQPQPGDGGGLRELPPEIAQLLAQPSTPGGPPAPAPIPPGPRRSRTSLVLLSAAAFLILLSAAWGAVAPDAAPTAGNLARQYITPGIAEARRIGVSLIGPVLERAGLPIDPNLAFNVIGVFIAFLIVRSFFRELMDLRYRSRRRYR